MLAIKNLTKLFNGKKVLDAISLTVKPGEIALLLGGSGVGKSTLLRVLNNLETMDSGTITLDGEALDVKKISQTHAVGMVFQGYNLFEHLSVEHNITLPLEKVLKKSPAEAQAIAHDLLEKYGLRDKADLPVSKLSGGQKQRLAIARTLAMSPHVICMDEPTSALDPLLTRYVSEQITHLAQQGYIVLVASHDMSLLENLTCTIYLMEGGKIVETASADELRSQPEKFKKLDQFMRGNK